MNPSRDNLPKRDSSRAKDGEPERLGPDGQQVRARGRVVVDRPDEGGLPEAEASSEGAASTDASSREESSARPSTERSADADAAARRSAAKAAGATATGEPVGRTSGSSFPPQRSSAREGLSSTTYSQVHGSGRREERVSPGSIPPPPAHPPPAHPPAEETVPGRPTARADEVPIGARTILGATPLKKVDLGATTVGFPQEAGGGGAGQTPGRQGGKTLVSAPVGARTLFGGSAEGSRSPGPSPAGSTSSAPPPVPDVGKGVGGGFRERPSKGPSEPYLPRTLESLRAVTAPGPSESPEPSAPEKSPMQPVPAGALARGAFNRTLTGASFRPKGIPGSEGLGRDRSSFRRERGGGSEEAPPTPMRPARARVVDSSTSSFPPEPSYPSSEDLAASISAAAGGQLRESELPVPSERLDPGVLRQLGQLDEALKSSPRYSSGALTGIPSSEDEEDSSRIPSSAWNAPSPGSVPALSALPTALKAEEGASGLPTVGRYEVLARLKSGGMGSVYMCRLSGNAGFRRLFAMKVLHAHLASDREALLAFEREARVLAALHHPNVVGVVDVGSAREPYIVLEYIEGGSLHELFRATASGRDPRLVIAAVLEALDGLRAAHLVCNEQGEHLELVHCDVCPQNILVGVDGTARLTDFGISRTKNSPKKGETLRGKPLFIAPERLESPDVDCRADLFSMGAVLYAGLTGLDAFAGESTEETRRSVSTKDPLPPSEVGLRPPPSLDWIVLKALTKDPNSRFQSAEEFGRQLRRVAEREGLIASRSELGAWVREVLAPSLRARRVAAQRGAGAMPRQEERNGSVPERLSPKQREIGSVEGTAPISSAESSGEDTEVISGVGGAGEVSRASRGGLYVAVGLVIAVIAWAVIHPDSLSNLFEVTAPPASGLPIEEREEPDVVVPEITAPFSNEGDAPSSDEASDSDESDEEEAR